ncbi:hypothetical protein M885DRAFT_533714 [Pelagophyceae sp. CCMP2097]|nr:hypothetical protein M885DRAFT_533714 [Pelagophyceae sp. CCMP2097]|mmetsp:Transcript_15258/g.51300  ORF Transcript_15258/g.51300 Transcript_15258/m.51300 type:complete len:564 (+) Transcript_15258:22-1713(+)
MARVAPGQGVPVGRAVLVDTDGDGYGDTLAQPVDLDGDGRADVLVAVPFPQGPHQGHPPPGYAQHTHHHHAHPGHHAQHHPQHAQPPMGHTQPGRPGHAHNVCCRRGHALYNVGKRAETWKCDCVDDFGGCRGGHREAYSRRDSDSYRCEPCDVDVCPVCYDHFAANSKSMPAAGERRGPQREERNSGKSASMSGDLTYVFRCGFFCIVILIIVVASIFGSRGGRGSGGGNARSRSKGTSGGSSSSSGSSSSGSSCFARGTRVALRNGSFAAIERLRIGDDTLRGGPVFATMRMYGLDEDLYKIDGVSIGETHAVHDAADGRWKRASEVYSAEKLPRRQAVLWNLITPMHRLAVSAGARLVEAADYQEVDETEEMLSASLAFLNHDVNRDANAGHAPNWDAGAVAALRLLPWDRRILKSCFPADSRVVLENGATKRISKVDVGDVVSGGGRVLGVLELDGAAQDLYELRGAVLSGHHTVYDTDGVWRHARDAFDATKLPWRAETLYNLITELHVIEISLPGGAKLVASDFLEADEHGDILDWNLDVLNAEAPTPRGPTTAKAA